MVCAKFLPYKLLTITRNWITLLSTVVATLSKRLVQYSTLAVEIPASVQKSCPSSAPHQELQLHEPCPRCPAVKI